MTSLTRGKYRSDMADLGANDGDWANIKLYLHTRLQIEEKGLNDEYGGDSRSFQNDGWLQPVL